MDSETLDTLSEQASAIVEYIVLNYTNIPEEELETIADNGDIMYSERTQNIYNDVLEIIELREEL